MKQKTITICSSMQFKSEISVAASVLEKVGWTVLTPDLSEKSSSYMNLTSEEQQAIKREFIQNHFNRIKQSEAILVLNYEKKGIAGYIGSNTIMEIGVAFCLNKKIYILNPLSEQGCTEEVMSLATSVLNGNLNNL